MENLNDIKVILTYLLTHNKNYTKAQYYKLQDLEELIKPLLSIQKFENMYFDYVNNFLTVGKFAEYYNMDSEKALKYINIGRKIYNTNIEIRKEIEDVEK